MMSYAPGVTDLTKTRLFLESRGFRIVRVTEVSTDISGPSGYLIECGLLANDKMTVEMAADGYFEIDYKNGSDSWKSRESSLADAWRALLRSCQILAVSLYPNFLLPTLEIVEESVLMTLMDFSLRLDGQEINVYEGFSEKLGVVGFVEHDGKVIGCFTTKDFLDPETLTSDIWTFVYKGISLNKESMLDKIYQLDIDKKVGRDDGDTDGSLTREKACLIILRSHYRETKPILLARGVLLSGGHLHFDREATEAELEWLSKSAIGKPVSAVFSPSIIIGEIKSCEVMKEELLVTLSLDMHQFDTLPSHDLYLSPTLKVDTRLEGIQAESVESVSLVSFQSWPGVKPIEIFEKLTN